MEVANSRPTSFSDVPRSIPLTEISAAYDYLQLDEHFTRIQWLRFVTMCDSVIIGHAKDEAKKRKKKRDKKGKKVDA